MTERCEECGRFMRHVWYLASPEPDDWQDYWICSKKHGDDK